MACGAAVLLILLSAVPEADGRGTEFDPAGPAEVRARVRLGGSVAAAAAFATTFEPTAYRGPKVGLGLSLDLGLVFGDRVALFLHIEGNMLPPFFSMLGGGLAFEVFLNDRVSLGAGTNFVAHFGGNNIFGLSLPFRASFFPRGRGKQDKERKGLVIGLQAGPVLGIYLLLGSPDLAFSTSVTVGYGSW